MTDYTSETLNPNNAALLLIDHQVGTITSESPTSVRWS
jgi:hypothetical protein